MNVHTVSAKIGELRALDRNRQAGKTSRWRRRHPLRRHRIAGHRLRRPNTEEKASIFFPSPSITVKIFMPPEKFPADFSNAKARPPNAKF